MTVLRDDLQHGRRHRRSRTSALELRPGDDPGKAAAKPGPRELSRLYRAINLLEALKPLLPEAAQTGLERALAAIDAANKLKGLMIAAAARKLEAAPGDIECLGEIYRAGAQDKDKAPEKAAGIVVPADDDAAATVADLLADAKAI